MCRPSCQRFVYFVANLSNMARAGVLGSGYLLVLGGNGLFLLGALDVRHHGVVRAPNNLSPPLCTSSPSMSYLSLAAILSIPLAFPYLSLLLLGLSFDRPWCPSTCHRPSLPSPLVLCANGAARPTEPRKFPCSSAPCRVHTEEANNPPGWPRASKQSSQPAVGDPPQRRLLNSTTFTCRIVSTTGARNHLPPVHSRSQSSLALCGAHIVTTFMSMVCVLCFICHTWRSRVSLVARSFWCWAGTSGSSSVRLM